MRIESAIELIANWLDAVHVESALARIEERRAEYLEQEGRHSPINPLAVPSAAHFRVALHEAAHAVLASRTAIGVARVVAFDSGSGSVSYARDPTDHPIAAAVVHLAGPAIELLAGADERRQFHLSISSDVQAARLAIDAYPVPISVRTCAAIVLCAVTEQAGTIVRVARAIRALGELDGPTVAALCGPPQ